MAESAVYRGFRFVGLCRTCTLPNHRYTFSTTSWSSTGSTWHDNISACFSFVHIGHVATVHIHAGSRKWISGPDLTVRGFANLPKSKRPMPPYGLESGTPCSWPERNLKHRCECKQMPRSRNVARTGPQAHSSRSAQQLVGVGVSLSLSRVGSGSCPDFRVWLFFGGGLDLVALSGFPFQGSLPGPLSLASFEASTGQAACGSQASFLLA